MARAKQDDPPPTPRVSTGTYRAFQDDALRAIQALDQHRAALDARRTNLATSLTHQLEAMAADFAAYEPDAGKRAERVSRFYDLQEQVARYLAGDR